MSPVLSIVIPAYNSQVTLKTTLDSLFADQKSKQFPDLEIIVIDDGSEPSLNLPPEYPEGLGLKLVHHEKNRGMCAARNTGIENSHGDFVTILDSDDTFVEGWRIIFQNLLQELPKEANVIYTPCKTPRGELTVSDPDFRGWYSLEMMLNENPSGEYLPIFRGEYIRKTLYRDIGTKKSCGILSYLSMAREGPFWVSKLVLRTYNDQQAGSVSQNWTNPVKARQTALCYQILLEEHGELYRRMAPKIYHTKYLRYALYLKLASEKGRLNAFRKGASIHCLKETLATFVILWISPVMIQTIVQKLKALGVIRKYG